MRGVEQKIKASALPIFFGDTESKFLELLSFEQLYCVSC
jgi:hypothetical protein